MPDVIEFFRSLFELIRHEELWFPLLVVLTVVIFVGFSLGRYVPKFPWELKPEAVTLSVRQLQVEKSLLHRELAACRADLDTCRRRESDDNRLKEMVLSEDSALWQVHECRPRPGLSTDVSQAKIIYVANNKGGVGKTTLTAGLAAYFERKRNKRVLLIDLDYQGSLTKWMLTAAGINIPAAQSRRLAAANRLIDGRALNEWSTEVLGGGHFPRTLNAQLITADYTLREYETKLMLRWLWSNGDPDIRYHVSEALLSPNVQDGFDIVLIDAPPRLTTGGIGALIAATHVFVPTVLDPLSVETLASFLRETWSLRQKFNPRLELAGVVGTMTTARPIGNSLSAIERDSRGIVEASLLQWPVDPHVFETDIQNIAAISNVAGRSNPYFSNAMSKTMFDLVGDELCSRIGWPNNPDPTEANDERREVHTPVA
jgi:cellulose biosynthesis protein BcsQ